MLMSGRVAFSGIKPELRPKKPPNTATVVHVMRVAEPKPDVGITSGRVMRSSKKLFPGNRFLART